MPYLSIGPNTYHTLHLSTRANVPRTQAPSHGDLLLGKAVSDSRCRDSPFPEFSDRQAHGLDTINDLERRVWRCEMYDTIEGECSQAFASPPDRIPRDDPSDGVLVAIRIDASADQFSGLADTLLATASEVRQLGATLVFVADIPLNASVAREIAAIAADLAHILPIDSAINPTAGGIASGIDRVLALALTLDRDIFLLDAISLPRPGSLAEMMAVAYLDPMIGVVSPRSDRSRTCASPIPEALRGYDLDANYRAHLTVERHLPRVSYVPTAAAFCLFIKRVLLVEFGTFNAVAANKGCAEEEFVRRCNQRGYRAVLANRAYVHCIGRDRRDDADEEFLSRRYPEYQTIVENYRCGANYHAERVLSGLVLRDGRVRVVFDCRILKSFHNGTFEHLTALLTAFARNCAKEYEIRVISDPDSYRFHGLDKVKEMRCCEVAEAIYEPAAIAFRLSQPTADSTATLAHCGVITGTLILDTIAMDCQQLDRADLATLWQHAADNLDIIAFNSEFSRDQFARRFSIPAQTIQLVSMCSTDLKDYLPTSGKTAEGGGGILLIGNHYPHKHVRETCVMLERVGSTLPITSFGLDLDDQPGVVSSYASGRIARSVVDTMYRKADIVLFPSHYEGFGLPIMHALARRIPVIARETPAAREIKRRCIDGANLHLFASTEAMAKAATRPPAWLDASDGGDTSALSWRDAGLELGDIFKTALERVSYDRVRLNQSAALANARIAQSELRAILTEEGAKRAARQADVREKAAVTQLQRAEARLARSARLQTVLDEIATARQMSGHDRIALWPGLADRLDAIVRRQSDLTAPSGNISARLSLRSDIADVGELRADLFRWSRTLLRGGRLRLDLLRIAAGDLDPHHFARALLAIAWCRLDHLRLTRRRMVIIATRIVEPVLPASLSNDLIVAVTYRVLLGREPDTSGLNHYMALLATGLSRDALVEEIACSDERWTREISANRRD